MNWSARWMFHARTAVTTLVPLERGHGGISRRCSWCSWKRTRLRLSGWLKHAQHAHFRLSRSGEITVLRVLAQVWSGAGEHGRSNRARTTRCPPYGRAWKIGKHRPWHLSRIPASRRARRVRQHSCHHVSRGHRGHFTKLSPISALLACIGQGSTLGLTVTRATATNPMLGAP